MKNLRLSITLLALVAAFGGSALAQLPPPRVDHFRCYLVPTSPAFTVAAQLVEMCLPGFKDRGATYRYAPTGLFKFKRPS